MKRFLNGLHGGSGETWLFWPPRPWRFPLPSSVWTGDACSEAIPVRARCAGAATGFSWRCGPARFGKGASAKLRPEVAPAAAFALSRGRAGHGWRWPWGQPAPRNPPAVPNGGFSGINPFGWGVSEGVCPPPRSSARAVPGHRHGRAARARWGVLTPRGRPEAR